MTQQHLILIGGGNMGGAMARRWRAGTSYVLHVVETDAARRAELEQSGLACHATLAEAPVGDIYVLAVKPQQFLEISTTLKGTVGNRQPLLVSIMAGVPLAALRALSPHAVRAMPNLPALIGESMSVLVSPGLDARLQQSAAGLFALLGEVAWVADEAQLHAVTAISGSGPAYVFAFMEALEHAAIAQGLDAALARTLTLQTVRGAAALAGASPDDVAALRAQVTSKGGTTEAALRVLAEGNFGALVEAAARAAAERSKSLADG